MRKIHTWSRQDHRGTRLVDARVLSPRPDHPHEQGLQLVQWFPCVADVSCDHRLVGRQGLDHRRRDREKHVGHGLLLDGWQVLEPVQPRQAPFDVGQTRDESDGVCDDNCQ